MIFPSPPTGAQEWPLLTVNILSYNRLSEVRLTLMQLQEADYPREQLEIIVVDNASSDGTGEMIGREFPDVKVLRLDPNRGIAGWNAGFEQGRGDFFLVLDDDSAPQEGLKEAVQFLESNPTIGILACQIVGGPFTTQGWEDHRDIVGFIGCGALIRREVLERIGGFAPWLYLYAHEWEYGVRCLDAGFDIRYFKPCIVHHRASTLNRSTRRGRIYTTRNELLIIHKHFARQRPLLLARTILHNAHCFRNEGARTFLYVLRGFGMFWRQAPKLQPVYVKPRVQQRYVALYRSTQPLIATFFQRLSKRLKL